MTWWVFTSQADADAAQDAAFALMPKDRDAAGNDVLPPITTCWDVPRQTVDGRWAIVTYSGMALPDGATTTETNPFSPTDRAP